MKPLSVAAALASGLVLAASCLAATPEETGRWPARPIKLIVGFAAGGPGDTMARVHAEDLSMSLGQPVIVENRTGANGLIATDLVQKAPADGYTLGWNSVGHTTNVLLSKEAKYHPVKDFAPVILAEQLPLLVVTKGDSPFNSVSDLVKAAKEKPGELTYSSAGMGSSGHLAGALFESLAEVKMLHVPFRGNAPALAEVRAGRISTVFYAVVGLAAQVSQGQLKALGVTGDKRHPDFPGTPTMTEAGVPGFEEVGAWQGLFAPAGTPRPVVSRLNEAVNHSLAKPATRERLSRLGAVVVGSTPEEFSRFLEKDLDRWGRVIKAAGLKPE
jgi:tripartite-type tricarboxylate transporter receptor subunit TctC